MMKKKKTKVKQHYRKTKKGKTKVREHRRKSKNRSASGQCVSCGRIKKLNLHFRMCDTCIKKAEKEILNRGGLPKTYRVIYKKRGPKEKDEYHALVKHKVGYPKSIQREIKRHIGYEFDPVVKSIKVSDYYLKDKEFEPIDFKKEFLKKMPKKMTEKIKPPEKKGEGYIEISEGEVKIPRKFKLFGARGCPYCKGDPNKVCPICETKERKWMGPFRIRSSGSGLGDRMKAEEHLDNLNKELRKKTIALDKLTDGDPLKQEKLIKEIKTLKKRINVFTGKEEW